MYTLNISNEKFTTNEPIHPKTLYLVWRNKTDQRTNDGIGYKIFGAIFAYQLCKENNINFKIDATDDICSNFLKNVSSDEHDKIKNQELFIFKYNDEIDPYSVIKQKLANTDKIYVYISKYPKYQLTEEDKVFAKFLLQPKPELQTEFERKISTLPENYGIKQFRYNDAIFSMDIEFNDGFYNKFLNSLEENYATTDVILSNSKIVKQYMKMVYFEKYKTKINVIMCGNQICNVQHIGQSTDIELVKNSFIEFYIACNAKYIKSYTSYDTPCNFVYLPSLLYNIPFETSYIK
jgi:hypothetical protein